MKLADHARARGYSTSYLFMTLSVLFTVSLLMVTIFTDKFECFDNSSPDRKAQLAAEYGVSKAISEIRKNPCWNGMVRIAGNDRQIYENRKMPYSNDTYSIWVCNNFYGEKEMTGIGGVKVLPGRCYIMAMGKTPDNEANIVEKFAAALIEKSTPFADFALFADEKIEINGKVDIQSATSLSKQTETASANLGTNDNRKNSIVFNNACGVIDGSIFVGPGVSGSIGGSSDDSKNIKIKGSKKKMPWNRPLPPVVIPKEIPQRILRKEAVSDGFSLKPGSYAEKLIVEKDETVLLAGPGEYVFEGIDFKENGRIVADTTGGPVRIYLTGDLSTGRKNDSSGIINFNAAQQPEPSHLLIYGTDKCSNIEIVGNEEYYMGIYARNARIAIGGNGRFQGSFVGKEIVLSDYPSIVFDKSTGKPDEGIMTIKLISWQRF